MLLHVVLQLAGCGGLCGSAAGEVPQRWIRAKPQEHEGQQSALLSVLHLTSWTWVTGDTFIVIIWRICDGPAFKNIHITKLPSSGQRWKYTTHQVCCHPWFLVILHYIDPTYFLWDLRFCKNSVCRRLTHFCCAVSALSQLMWALWWPCMRRSTLCLCWPKPTVSPRLRSKTWKLKWACTKKWFWYTSQQSTFLLYNCTA